MEQMILKTINGSKVLSHKSRSRDKETFCSGLDWLDVFNRKLKPPFVPAISSDGDTSNFQDYSDEVRHH